MLGFLGPRISLGFFLLPLDAANVAFPESGSQLQQLYGREADG